MRESRFLSLAAPQGNALTVQDAAVTSIESLLDNQLTSGEYDFAGTNGLVTCSAVSNVAALIAGDVVCCDFYIEAPAAQAFERITLRISFTPSGGDIKRREEHLDVTPQARRWIFPTSLPHTVSGFSFALSAEAFYAEGVRDRIRIHHPRIYRASRPMPHDVFRAINLDADITLKAHHADLVTVRNIAPLSADRTVNFDPTHGIPGVTAFRIVRAAAGTGNYILGTTGVSLPAINDEAIVALNMTGAFVCVHKGKSA